MFFLHHILSCKKVGFISIQLSNIRDVTANLLKGVCRDVLMKPKLQPLELQPGERFEERTAKIADEARCDVRARGFWSAVQVAFLDIRVFNTSGNRYANQSLSKSYEVNEKEKKRAYNHRVQEVEHGMFIPLMVSATGGMGRECKKFYSRLSQMVSDK